MVWVDEPATITSPKLDDMFCVARASLPLALLDTVVFNSATPWTDVPEMTMPSPLLLARFCSAVALPPEARLVTFELTEPVAWVDLPPELIVTLPAFDEMF